MVSAVPFRRTSSWPVAVGRVEIDEDVLDEIVDIDKLFHFRVSFGAFQSRPGTTDGELPFLERAIDELNVTDTGIERVVVASVSPKMVRHELGIRSLHRVVESPVESVQIQVEVAGRSRELAHIECRIPREGVTDVLSDDDRISEIRPTAVTLCTQHEVVERGCWPVRKEGILQLGWSPLAFENEAKSVFQCGAVRTPTEAEHTGSTVDLEITLGSWSLDAVRVEELE